MLSLVLSLLLEISVAAASTQQVVSGVFIPPLVTYLLDEPFKSNASEKFIDTRTSNNPVNALLAEARNATYYSFDPEFDAIFGSSATIQEFEYPGVSFASVTGIVH